MSATEQPPLDEVAVVDRRRMRLTRLGLAVSALALFNVAAYWVAGTATVQSFLASLQGAVYLGAFLLALVANITVLVPIPYNPIIFQMAAAAPLPWLVAICAAAGSVLGETTGYLAGRAGKGAFEDTRFGRWVSKQLTHPVRAFVVIFLVAAPPNPLFDMAGLAAGTLGVRPRIFFTAVFLGRSLRFLLFAWFATRMR